MNQEVKKTYEAEVVEVFSGDDLVVMVNLGVEDLYKKCRVRLHGVDTPSAVRAGADTQAGRLRTYVRSLCKGRKLTLEVQNRGLACWMVIAQVQTPEGLYNINDDLINQGFGYKRETNQ